MSSANDKPASEKQVAKPKCGIIMPMSAIDGLPKEHWIDVCTILKDAATTAGFEPNLVSDADEVSVIQKTIVQNVYNNEIIICDVSAKNSNVMFELGMRLAFDKPTIIIKDDKTDFSFDTSIIEHIPYPRDLRFNSILVFKEKLSNKLKSTLEAAKKPEYTTFLKHFGEFTVAKLTEKEVGLNEYFMSALDMMRKDIHHLRDLTLNASSLSKGSRFDFGEWDKIHETVLKELIPKFKEKYPLWRELPLNEIQARFRLFVTVNRAGISLRKKMNFEEIWDIAAQELEE